MDDKKVDKLTFEEAFENLDLIVKKMSEPDLALEESFKAYEEGVKLLKYCNDTLDKVEKKVMKINENGQESEF